MSHVCSPSREMSLRVCHCDKRRCDLAWSNVVLTSWNFCLPIVDFPFSVYLLHSVLRFYPVCFYFISLPPYTFCHLVALVFSLSFLPSPFFISASRGMFLRITRQVHSLGPLFRLHFGVEGQHPHYQQHLL